MTKQPNTLPANDRRSPSADSGGHFHAVSLSGGKDSSYLLLRMIELGMPIDAVISADTGMEFPEMYDHLAKLDDHLYRERGIHITTLRHPKGFEYLMFDEPKQKPSALERRARLGVPPYGNGWPGIRVRWCTGQLKTHLISKEVNRLKAEKNALHYVGIAADEAWRCKGEQYPLVEWGVTEAEALQGCYDRGFDFGGLYEIYHRCSCWCCPFQRIDELRKLRVNHPELWARLRRLDNRARAQFGAGPLGLVGANCARSVSALRRKLRIASLLLLSKSQPLRWVAVWLRGASGRTLCAGGGETGMRRFSAYRSRDSPGSPH